MAASVYEYPQYHFEISPEGDLRFDPSSNEP